MYTVKILLGVKSKAETFKRAHSFTFSKARDGGNRPRIFRTRIFYIYRLKNHVFSNKSLFQMSIRILPKIFLPSPVSSADPPACRESWLVASCADPPSCLCSFSRLISSKDFTVTFSKSVDS